MNNKKRILLVEDDPNFGIILRDFLKMNEYDVILAKNGMEGFEKFKKFEFNLCILDVMMPYKDGFTLASEIKGLSPDMPIIFLMAKSMKEDVLKGYKVGADDYLKKPFDSDVLLFKIKAILKRNKLSSIIESEETEFIFSSFHFNSKSVFPDEKSYSLGKLVSSLGIEIKNRHRADGDAMATLKLFKKICLNINKKQLSKFIKINQ